MCRPASSTSLVCVGVDIYRRQITFNPALAPAESYRSARPHAWLFWRKPQPCGFQCSAIHLGLGPLCLVYPPIPVCAEGSHLLLSLPTLITCPSLPCLLVLRPECRYSPDCQDLDRTGQRVPRTHSLLAPNTQPAGSQLQLFAEPGPAGAQVEEATSHKF